MARAFFLVIVLFSLNPHVKAQEKIKLPDYRSWSSSQPHFGSYSTIPGCNTKTIKELLTLSYEINTIEIELKSSQYTPPDDSGFLDVIYDSKDKPQLAFYYLRHETGNTIHLFRRQRFFLLGHRWKLVDSLPETINGETVGDEVVVAFQIRNCIFFLFK